MPTVLDYEMVETLLGDKLRRSDNLDIHADHFFPVSLLDMLFHYSESVHGREPEGDGRYVHRNFHGHDFDRWIDNIVAGTRLCLVDEEGNRKQVSLIDIASMTVDGTGPVTVTLDDDTLYRLASPGYTPVVVHDASELTPELDIENMFDKPPVDSDSEPYMGFGLLAHVVRVVADKSGMDPARVDARAFSERLFEHFKDELLSLIPSLWNDMEHIMHYAKCRLT